MVSNRLAFAALGVACVAAAAGGSYVATRHNAAGQLVPAVAATGSASTVGAAETPGPAPASPAADETPARTAPAARPADTRVAAPARPVQTPRNTAGTDTAPAARPEPPAAVAEHAPSTQTIPGAAVALEPAPVAEARDERPAEPAATPEPPKPSFEELTVAADSVIGLQTETTLSSERARIEDRVEARVVRDVRVSGRVAIPAGSRVFGSVVAVERGGRARTRARLGIRFHTLALADGTRLPISTDTIFRYGDDPANGAAAKIGGGAVAGAILGAIIGGGKGAAIGATTGAAGGGAAVMSSERSEAIFPSGAQVTARIVSPVTITIDR